MLLDYEENTPLEGGDSWYTGMAEEVQGKVFKTKNFYYGLLEQNQVDWHKLLYDNVARPRAKFVLCQACQNKLATKDRLRKFRIFATDNSNFRAPKKFKSIINLIKYLHGLLKNFYI